jgi:hypothetical protein
MIKKLLLNALRTDPEFALEVWGLIARPQLFDLNRQNAYIMVVDIPLSDKQVDLLTQNIPADMNFSIIHGAEATLVNLTNT